MISTWSDSSVSDFIHHSLSPQESKSFPNTTTTFNKSGPVPPPTLSPSKKTTQSNSREVPQSSFTWKKTPLNTALTKSSKNSSKSTVHSSTIQFTWERKTSTKKKYKNRKKNSPTNRQNSRNNGKPKENNSPKMISKTLSTEPPPSSHGITSSKDLMKTNHSGSETRPKSLKLNTEISTKTSSRTPAIHSPGHASRSKVMSISLDWCTFLKEHHTINLKSSMKRKIKSNFLSGEFWSMISLKTSYPNTWTSSRPLLTLITCPWMSTEKTFNRWRFWKKLDINFWASQLKCWLVLTQSHKMKTICLKTRNKRTRKRILVLPQHMTRKSTHSTSSGKTLVRT